MIWASQLALVVKNLPARAGDARDEGSIPGSGRSPGVGNGNTLQYSFFYIYNWKIIALHNFVVFGHTPVFLRGKFHGQSRLEGHRKSDMTEQPRHSPNDVGGASVRCWGRDRRSREGDWLSFTFQRKKDFCRGWFPEGTILFCTK